MAWLKVLRSRLRALRDGEAVHDEMDEEFRFHIDMRTEENIRRGLSPADARRDAERRFGSRRKTRRGFGWRCWESPAAPWWRSW